MAKTLTFVLFGFGLTALLAAPPTLSFATGLVAGFTAPWVLFALFSVVVLAVFWFLL